MEEKPKCVFMRLPQVLEIFPISRSSWLQGCKDGKYPKPIKLGPKTTVWRSTDIENLIAEISENFENVSEKN